MKHYFFNLLRGHDNRFYDLTQLLDCFNNNFFDKAAQFMPDEWKTDELTTIQQHVQSIVEHRNIFAEQLTLILAA